MPCGKPKRYFKPLSAKALDSLKPCLGIIEKYLEERGPISSSTHPYRGSSSPQTLKEVRKFIQRKHYEELADTLALPTAHYLKRQLLQSAPLVPYKAHSTIVGPNPPSFFEVLDIIKKEKNGETRSQFLVALLQHLAKVRAMPFSCATCALGICLGFQINKMSENPSQFMEATSILFSEVLLRSDELVAQTMDAVVEGWSLC